MKPPPLDYTHGRTTLGVECHHRLWTTHMVERHQARHDVTAFGQRKRSNHVGHGMPSSRFGITHGPTTSGVASHHRPWLAHTVGRRRPWHEITTLGQHTLSNNVRRGIPSSPLGITHDRTRSGVTCHHRLWTAHTVRLCGAWHDINAFGQHTRSNNVGRGMPSSP